MKRKIVLLLIMFILICGCSDVKKEDMADIVNKISLKNTSYNTYRNGYKYNLPKGMSVKEYIMYSETLQTSTNDYYLYVDIISYYNKKKVEYKKCDSCYYSSPIEFKGKYGYIEINLQENNQYLIEIMFNYAKIEVMVDESDVNIAVNYAVSILRSIEYNDNIIANLVGDDVLNYQEEVYNIFNATSSDSNLLQFEDVEDYEEEEEEIKDSDLIN